MSGSAVQIRHYPVTVSAESHALTWNATGHKPGKAAWLKDA
ncbi:hypothetical protein GRAN_0229 [Granulicella sibirica]|uniref:Uncharacterized protein n=1 Tax=Granulicella sibirica TaxID=2479048 RepID=A0A4Q0T4J4_9BACT|nr:hypothetical protein GRAN_0229 [Granulicella sibirica]